MKKRISVCMIILLTISLLTACGGASKDQASNAVSATMAAAMDSVSYKAESNSTYASESTYSEVGTTSALGGSSAINTVTDTSRKLIRTVNLDVETEDFETLMEKLEGHIAALGGYIEQSDISGNSIQSNYSRRRAYMTIRIPSTELDQFISSVEADGNITNKSETTSDVTLQYSDLESRKKTLTLEQDRIWELLEKADTLEAVIALEERLSEINYELESMESRLRLYDNQVEYSTVYVNVSEVKIYTPTAPLTIGERITKGFAQNVENMKEFAVDVMVLVITSIPIWVPILLVAMIVFIFVKRKATEPRIRKNLFKISLNKDKKNNSDSNDQ